ncbi:MAG TPA: imidazolonepropionase [Ktedonobacterales bacterium]|jgi:imidazolonepropionase|nr:imidazolonepropionase [Ktedonobacterales bacterium]
MSSAASGGVRLQADWLLTGVSRLVTLESDDPTNPLGVIEQGAVAALDGRIVWVGPEELASAVIAIDGIAPSAMVDAGGRAVLPGFVDAHTHFVFAGDRAEEFHLRHAGVGYEELARQGRGILSTVRATRAASFDELRALGEARLRSFATYGTTTVEGKTGYGLDLATERRILDVMESLAKEPGLPRIVPTFLGAHTLPPEGRGSPEARAAYVDAVCDEMLPAFTGHARFCDVFCESSAFTVEESRRVLERARNLGYALKLHANQLGPSGGAALAAELGAVSADHLDYASDEELDALRAADVTGVLLPGCSFTLSAPYPSARRLLDRGLNVALATDFNPGTSYSESMLMMIALAVSAMGMTLAEAVRAATLGGAGALALADEVGSLAPGKRCDLIVLRGADERELAYHFGVNLVAETYISGQRAMTPA